MKDRTEQKPRFMASDGNHYGTMGEAWEAELVWTRGMVEMIKKDGEKYTAEQKPIFTSSDGNHYATMGEALEADRVWTNRNVNMLKGKKN